MFKAPKAPPPPPPPPPAPPPKPIPQATDPTVREAQLEAERRGRGRQGRRSTLLAGPLGDGSYGTPATRTSALTAGNRTLG